MGVKSLTVPLIVLTLGIAVLTVVVFILYCSCLKYIKRRSLTKMTTSPTVSIEKTASEESNIPTGTTSFPTISNHQTSVEIDMIQTAQNAIDSLAPLAELQNIKLHLSTICEELKVRTFPKNMDILFHNLIDNSMKYMGHAGNIVIAISLLDDDIFLILKGTISESKEGTVTTMEPDSQDSPTVTHPSLELTPSKIIVESLGGTIYAKGNPQKGIAIYIQFPFSQK